MAMPVPALSQPSTLLIQQLGFLCHAQGLGELAARLDDLESWIRADLESFEAELALIPRGARVVQKSAQHLLDLGGKHLRPMCVAMAAKNGDGFHDAARHLAVAVELVHSATLLHDDVVDHGQTRRGAPSPRALYGNAASVFAGDWLLVQALQRVRRSGVDKVLDHMLATIDEMIMAESLQLERRGIVRVDVDSYFKVIDGKTAALFRWGLYAGGRAGGLDDEKCHALENFGRDLGVAFQAVDDLLDFSGQTEVTGKALLTDLREGKMTYPLVVALDRDRELTALVEECVANVDSLPDTAVRAILASLERTGALRECRDLAHRRVQSAIASLAPLADGPAKEALITVAEATAYREK